MAIRIRALRLEDLREIERLHKAHYSEFELPQFGQMLNAFVIEDDKEEIVMAGALEKVGEAVLVTNKEKSRIKIGKALVEAQQCIAFTAKVNRIRDVYAFVNNDDYADHLKQHGFSDCDRALKLRIP